MKTAIQYLTWAATIMLMALPALGAESAVLRNGFSIRHERRQVIGTITRLYVDGDDSSFVDIPTAEIDHFEAAPADSSAKTHPHPSLPQVSAPHPLDLTELVNTASGTYRLDPDLVNSVIRAESAFNIRAVSPKGAQGLMQLMPQTASQLGVQNAFDPQANVDGGARYLRELLERYNFDLIKALAAYNAGPQRVEQYGGVPPYSETKAYVARIVRDFNKKKLASRTSSQSTTSMSKTSTVANKPSGKPATSKPSPSAAQTKTPPGIQ